MEVVCLALNVMVVGEAVVMRDVEIDDNEVEEEEEG